MGDKPGEVGRGHIINGSLSHIKEFGLYLKVQGEWVKVSKLRVLPSGINSARYFWWLGRVWVRRTQCQRQRDRVRECCSNPRER